MLSYTIEYCLMLMLAFEAQLVWLLTAAVWFIVVCWLVSTPLTLLGLSGQKLLLPKVESTLPNGDTPFVSILVPARNEQHRVISESILSILAQDYGRFEVVAVNDRSTDKTGSILESLAKRDSRLHVVHSEVLPTGWLGKPFAMQQALNRATGEWILATDADMIFDPAALRTAMSRVVAEKGDAITLIPHFEAISFWERVMIPTWTWVFLMFTVFYRINNPKSPGAVGIGGFFLIKRSLLDRLGCYEALKGEVMEDVRLAEQIKQSGARLVTAYAPGLVRTRMYSNFREMWECSTKNWFSGVKFSVPFAMYCVVSMYMMAVLPPLMFLVSAIGIVNGVGDGLWWLFFASGLAWILQVLNIALASVRARVSPLYSLTAPLGLGLLYAMLFDSCMRITIGTGVTWKGRRIYERDGVRPPRYPPRMYDSAMDERG
jgi:chlorobactene glucosyltransferase